MLDVISNSSRSANAFCMRVLAQKEQLQRRMPSARSSWHSKAMAPQWQLPR
ncbi:hypothetical protein N185_04530 [Sinorhizobium sp. GW3]|nr:hypothetical protein N185_04530 [Sinorhizobium sp. GW3]